MLTGCAAPTTDGGAGVRAYAVGDRGNFVFDPIVVSLPLRGANAPYQNLHIALAALVNPRDPKWYYPHDVEYILRRAEPRIAASLSASLAKLGEQSLDGAPQLRTKAAGEAQAIVNDLLKAWKDGDKYHVEVVVVNLYWTDASVGR
jgi:hypothetical protein